MITGNFVTEEMIKVSTDKKVIAINIIHKYGFKCYALLGVGIRIYKIVVNSSGAQFVSRCHQRIEWYELKKRLVLGHDLQHLICSSSLSGYSLEWRLSSGKP